MQWDSTQYLKFGKERTQPAIDLVTRIPLTEPHSILDVGCGPGNSTQVLKDRFPQADVLGIDRSENMIASACRDHPDLRFEVLDAGNQLGKLDGPFDVVFSNACIQWIPDHPHLLSELFRLLSPGGVLAVQIPMNEKEPIHQLIGETVSNTEWQKFFPQPRIFYNLEQNMYVDLLAEWTTQFMVWQTTYFHILHSHQDILEWYRGTGLRPYLSALSAERKPDFEQVILQKIMERYPKQKNGDVIFRFPRFFFVAVAK